jgi:vitamin B12 transporter
MGRRSLWWAVMVSLGIWGWPSMARSQQPVVPQEQTLEEVVVTAARIPEALSRTTADVTVITRQDLERRQITTVLDALRTVPALNVVQSGTSGSVTSIFARGGNSSHTLVLIDGVRVNSPTNGIFDFANLTTEGVERIEVVRGAASALYGSDGLTAVINIITRKGEGAPRSSVRVDAGSYQTFREQAQSSGRLGPVGYAVDIARTDSSGKFPHDEYTNTAGAARLDYQALPNLNLDLSARYTHALKNFPAVPGRTDFFGVQDPTQNSREDLTTVSLGASHAPTAWWDHRFQLSIVQDTVDFRDPQSLSSTSDTETTRLAADWQHNLRPVSWDTVSLGFQVDQAKGDQRDDSGALVLHKTLTNFAFYGQNQVTILDRLILAVGLRADENSAFGSHFSPKYSAAFLIPESGSKLRASYGEGFRAPSINDLAFPGFANPNLKPEKNRSLEFGMDQSLWHDRIQAGLTWFQSRFRDLIVASSGPIFIPVNVAHARTQGVEATLRFRPGFGLELAGSYTYLQTLDQNNQHLLRRPANSWNAAVNYAPWDRVNLNSTVLYVGKRNDFDPATFATTTNFKYVKWDAGASVKVLDQIGLLRKLMVFAKLENILGDRYQEVLGFPALGRRYMVGMSGEF